MNDRVKAIVERMRQNTQAIVDAQRQKAAEQTTQPECPPEPYQIILLTCRAPMSAGVDRRPSRRRELELELVEV